MTELGARLKEARTEKGYTLDDLQEITKIQKRYLVGIEEGNYSSMPGSFYVRAFIKQYAEAVGLNANEILDQYRTEIPSSQVSEVAQSFSQSHNRRSLAKASSSSKVMESVPKIIVGLFAVVIVIVVIALVSAKMSETAPPVEESDKPIEYEKKPLTKDPEEEEKDKEEEPAQTEEEPEETTSEQTIGQGVALSDGDSFEYTVTNTEQLKVRVEVTEGRSWIGMRNAAGAEQLGDNAREYAAGEVVEFDATENQYVRIRLGRALNVKVFINDEELQLVSDKTTQNIILKLEVTAQ